MMMLRIAIKKVGDPTSGLLGDCAIRCPIRFRPSRGESQGAMRVVCFKEIWWRGAHFFTTSR
jgi:hypothetical protein